MKRILILTAGFDDYHHAGARHLRDAIESLDEDARAEILDLFAEGRGVWSGLLHRTCLSLAQYAPVLWNGWRPSNPDSAPRDAGFGSLGGMHDPLEKILLEAQPDCVVSTSPAYGHLIQQIFHSHRERPFRLVNILTEALAASPAWFHAPGDVFCAANDQVAESLRTGGVPVARIKTLGFPVSWESGAATPATPLPALNEAPRVLYLVHSGKKKTGRAIERLLEQPDLRVTVVAGRDPELRARLQARFRDAADRVRVLGWTNELPELLRRHHLVIANAGLAVYEAMAAQCPILVNHAGTRQEDANAELVTRSGIGGVVSKNREAAALVEQAFADGARLWQEWRRNLKKIARPDATRRISELVLREIQQDTPARITRRMFEPPPERVMRAAPQQAGGQPRMLLCDFHIHTNYSDGKMSVPEVVDFYGERGFDCICLTDHLADPRRLLGKLSELSKMTLAPDQVAEYFAVIERERQRAWRRYQMLVMTGIEFNKDGLTRKTSAHLLGIDLKAPIEANLDLPETIARIHEQGGLAVASHPHVMKSEWGKNTLYLWENQDRFAPLLDAWEIANRDNLFNDIGLKRLPFIANSDLHKPKHIYSWKTLIHCEKDPEAIKHCIRRNEHVAITLYRDFAPRPGQGFRHGFELPAAAGDSALPPVFLPPTR